MTDLPLHNRAVLDTKVLSFIPRCHTPEKVAESIAASISALKIPKVHVMYLHAPDRTVALEKTCRAMNDAFLEGKFEKFGLSNYSPEEVEQIVEICEANRWVKPTVYQGHYNAIARIAEDVLIPTLRKHGISYYAYSPGAGGMFSGKVNQTSVDEPGTRWDKSVSISQFCPIHRFHILWLVTILLGRTMRGQANNFSILGSDWSTIRRNVPQGCSVRCCKSRPCRCQEGRHNRARRCVALGIASLGTEG